MPPAAARSRRGAFTLIELLAVIAIIGVLTSIVVVVGRGVLERGKVARARSELATLAAALESYKLQYGDYPWLAAATPVTPPEKLLFNALCGNLVPSNSSGMVPPAGTAPARVFVELSKFTVQDPTQLPDPAAQTIVTNAFLDPWSRAYQYRYRQNAADSGPGKWEYPSFVLWSCGPDGLTGDEATPAQTTIAVSGLPSVPADCDDIYAGR